MARTCSGPIKVSGRVESGPIPTRACSVSCRASHAGDGVYCIGTDCFAATPAEMTLSEAAKIAVASPYDRFNISARLIREENTIAALLKNVERRND